MGRPLRIRYANVGINFETNDVDTGASTITVSRSYENFYVNSAPVQYLTETLHIPVGGLSNGSVYFIRNTSANTTHLTFQLSSTVSGSIISLTSTPEYETHSLDVVRASGVQEMSNNDVANVITPLLLNRFVSPVATPVSGLTLQINDSSNATSIGVYTDTHTVESPDTVVGPSPSYSNTTYTFYQTNNVPSSLDPTYVVDGFGTLGTVRPVHYVEEDGIFKIKEMSNDDIINNIAPIVVNQMLQSNTGCYYLSNTGSIAGRTVVEVATFEDNYWANSTTETSDTYYLLRDTTAQSVPTKGVRPLIRKRSGYAISNNNLEEAEDDQISAIANLIGEYIRTTGIGSYMLQVSAPGVGTWQSQGTITNSVNDIGGVPYAGAYAQAFTQNYTGTYTQAYTGTFSQQFAGAFVNEFTNTYVNSYQGPAFTGINYTTAFTTNYQTAYTQVYTVGFATPYSTVYTQQFTGGFTTSYTTNFVGLYTANYVGIFSQSLYTAPALLWTHAEYTAGEVGEGVPGVYTSELLSWTGAAWTGPGVAYLGLVGYVAFENFTGPTSFAGWTAPTYTRVYTRTFAGWTGNVGYVISPLVFTKNVWTRASSYTNIINYTGEFFTRTDSYVAAFGAYTRTSNYTGRGFFSGLEVLGDKFTQDTGIVTLYYTAGMYTRISSYSSPSSYGFFPSYTSISTWSTTNVFTGFAGVYIQTREYGVSVNATTELTYTGPGGPYVGVNYFTVGETVGFADPSGVVLWTGTYAGLYTRAIVTNYTSIWSGTYQSDLYWGVYYTGSYVVTSVYQASQTFLATLPLRYTAEAGPTWSGHWAGEYARVFSGYTRIFTNLAAEYYTAGGLAFTSPEVYTTIFTGRPTTSYDIGFVAEYTTTAIAYTTPGSSFFTNEVQLGIYYINDAFTGVYTTTPVTGTYSTSLNYTIALWTSSYNAVFGAGGYTRGIVFASYAETTALPGGYGGDLISFTGTYKNGTPTDGYTLIVQGSPVTYSDSTTVKAYTPTGLYTGYVSDTNNYSTDPHVGPTFSNVFGGAYTRGTGYVRKIAPVDDIGVVSYATNAFNSTSFYTAGPGVYTNAVVAIFTGGFGNAQLFTSPGITFTGPRVYTLSYTRDINLIRGEIYSSSPTTFTKENAFTAAWSTTYTRENSGIGYVGVFNNWSGTTLFTSDQLLTGTFTITYTTSSTYTTTGQQYTSLFTSRGYNIDLNQTAIITPVFTSTDGQYTANFTVVVELLSLFTAGGATYGITYAGAGPALYSRVLGGQLIAYNGTTTTARVYSSITADYYRGTSWSSYTGLTAYVANVFTNVYNGYSKAYTRVLLNNYTNFYSPTFNGWTATIYFTAEYTGVQTTYTGNAVFSGIDTYVLARFAGYTSINKYTDVLINITQPWPTEQVFTATPAGGYGSYVSFTGISDQIQIAFTDAQAYTGGEATAWNAAINKFYSNYVMYTGSGELIYTTLITYTHDGLFYTQIFNSFYTSPFFGGIATGYGAFYTTAYTGSILSFTGTGGPRYTTVDQFTGDSGFTTPFYSGWSAAFNLPSFVESNEYTSMVDSFTGDTPYTGNVYASYTGSLLTAWTAPEQGFTGPAVYAGIATWSAVTNTDVFISTDLKFTRNFSSPIYTGAFTGGPFSGLASYTPTAFFAGWSSITWSKVFVGYWTGDAYTNTNISPSAYTAIYGGYTASAFFTSIINYTGPGSHVYTFELPLWAGNFTGVGLNEGYTIGYTRSNAYIDTYTRTLEWTSFFGTFPYQKRNTFVGDPAAVAVYTALEYGGTAYTKQTSYTGLVEALTYSSSAVNSYTRSFISIYSKRWTGAFASYTGSYAAPGYTGQAFQSPAILYTSQALSEQYYQALRYTAAWSNVVVNEEYTQVTTWVDGGVLYTGDLIIGFTGPMTPLTGPTIGFTHSYGIWTSPGWSGVTVYTGMGSSYSSWTNSYRSQWTNPNGLGFAVSVYTPSYTRVDVYTAAITGYWQRVQTEEIFTGYYTGPIALTFTAPSGVYGGYTRLIPLYWSSPDPSKIFTGPGIFSLATGYYTGIQTGYTHQSIITYTGTSPGSPYYSTFYTSVWSGPIEETYTTNNVTIPYTAAREYTSLWSYAGWTVERFFTKNIVFNSTVTPGISFTGPATSYWSLAASAVFTGRLSYSGAYNTFTPDVQSWSDLQIQYFGGWSSYPTNLYTGTVFAGVFVPPPTTFFYFTGDEEVSYGQHNVYGAYTSFASYTGPARDVLLYALAWSAAVAVSWSNYTSFPYFTGIEYTRIFTAGPTGYLGYAILPYTGSLYTGPASPFTGFRYYTPSKAYTPGDPQFFNSLVSTFGGTYTGIQETDIISYVRPSETVYTKVYTGLQWSSHDTDFYTRTGFGPEQGYQSDPFHYTSVYATATTELYTGLLFTGVIWNLQNVYAGPTVFIGPQYTGTYTRTGTAYYTKSFRAAVNYTGLVDIVRTKFFTQGTLFTGGYNSIYTSGPSMYYNLQWSGTYTTNTFTGLGPAWTHYYGYAQSNEPLGTFGTVVFSSTYRLDSIYFSGLYTKIDPLYVNVAYVGFYSEDVGYQGIYTHADTGSYAGIYTTVYSAFTATLAPVGFTGQYTQIYSLEYTTNYTAPAYTTEYTQLYAPLYTPTYTTLYTTAYTTEFTGLYTTLFTGAFGNAFTGSYADSYTNSFTGTFTGGTVLNTTTTETLTLWVRIA